MRVRKRWKKMKGHKAKSDSIADFAVADDDNYNVNKEVSICLFSISPFLIGKGFR